MRVSVSMLALCAGLSPLAAANIVTNPNDGRTWQGASVGTFAQLFYGSDTLATRTQVTTNQLLDDDIFYRNNYQPATLLANAWSLGGGGGTLGVSFDTTGTGSYGYGNGPGDVFNHANTIDDLWFQSSGTVGETVFDMHFDAEYAAVFAAVDHGPLPEETIESTVYLSNSPTGPWTQAEVKRVFLEGYFSNTGILWDGFCYVVQAQGGGSFRYASIIHGGPGALISDGDDEINGLMGLPFVPAPSTLALLGLSGLVAGRRRR